MKLIEGLNWRYATKKFDPTKKVSEADLEQIKEAVRLSASSYGLQLYKVIEVKDPEVREKIKPLAWNQTQITDASNLFIFCNETAVTEENVQAYLNRKADALNIDAEGLKGYGEFILGQMGGLSEEQQGTWTAKQVYIALGNLLAACGELEIDACPMEGFDPNGVNELLGLKEKGLNAAVIATVGYRSEEDETANQPKVRKTESTLFETI